ncbi:hypothetical protein ROSEINA2194_03390 [Roseburia inulinivorans DSM 16841]|uniref:Uncharacterized protein n=1 Tax=Roseburia inulinivorans DSM 16841 TaxID=622312 RepID=C0FXB1_9FIRM|nr:hypothetical protein ROSEINA2194_03390 [Roseburia inulinivorans DSM 16841]
MLTLSFSFNLTFLFLISFSGFSAGNPKDGVCRLTFITYHNFP